MADFRSQTEKDNDRVKAFHKEQNYKAAFEAAAAEAKSLHSKIAKLEDEQRQLKSQLQTFQEGMTAMRQYVESGLAKLAEDNDKLHALIRSGQDSDLKLVEQMDKNHRERMDQIMKLVDQKVLPNG